MRTGLHSTATGFFRLASALVLSSSLVITLPVQAESLLEIYELALKNDAQLEADKFAYEAGLENRTLGRSGLLPQINASFSFDDSETDRVDNIQPETGSGTFEQETENFQITLSQPLFDMSAWYEYRRGVTQSKLAEVQFSADQQALIVRVAEAYFNVLRAADNLQTAIGEETALKEQLEQTRQRYEVGLTAITEVHEAQAVYDNATATVLEARGNLDIAYEALEVLTARSHDTIAPLAQDFPVVNPTPAQRHEWVEFALQNNYELKTAQLSARSADQTAKAAKSQHLPTLTGTASYRETYVEGVVIAGQAFPNDTEDENVTFGIRLEMPLFSGGRVSGQRRQTAAQHLQAKSEVNRTQRNVIQSTRSLHLSVETGVAQVKARRQAIVSSQSALEATQSGYEVGTRNLVEVLQAQQAVYQAERDYHEALYNYIIDTFELRQAAGMLTPADVQQINASLQLNRQQGRQDFERP